MEAAANVERSMNQVTHMIPRNPMPEVGARGGDASSLLVDSAISHAEKLRRVLQLEQWINGTTPDNPLPAATRRKWQEERAQLLAELRLEELGAANAGAVSSGDAPERGRGATLWLRKILRRLRHGEVSAANSD
jgi:hypothetical protein